MEYLSIILPLPKTIYFNLRYLPLKQALKLPIFINYHCDISKIKGKIKLLNQIKPALIRIGFHKVPAINTKDSTRIAIDSNGILEFDGSAHIGRGSKLYVSKNAKLHIGDNFAISASSSILCYKSISFGRDIQFSWDCLVMDSDTHHIYNEAKEVMNSPKDIIFGNKIWIGCKSTILKGNNLPSNTVIGACSCITDSHNIRPNTIIVGTPAKSVKEIGSWEL